MILSTAAPDDKRYASACDNDKGSARAVCHPQCVRAVLWPYMQFICLAMHGSARNIASNFACN